MTDPIDFDVINQLTKERLEELYLLAEYTEFILMRDIGKGHISFEEWKKVREENKEE